MVVDSLDELRDMPSYAACGLIRFKTPMFRETTYRYFLHTSVFSKYLIVIHEMIRLLTEQQKVELHGKALRYLQLNTRRCTSCGEGQFATLLDDGLVFQDPRQAIDVHQLLERLLFGEIPYLQKTENELQKPVGSVKKKSWFRANRKLDKASTSSFSNVDYKNCQCEPILMTAYSRILEHCRGIGEYLLNIDSHLFENNVFFNLGRKDLILTLILAYAEVSLSSCNAAQARKLLIDGEALANDVSLRSYHSIIHNVYK